MQRWVRARIEKMTGVGMTDDPAHIKLPDPCSSLSRERSFLNKYCILSLVANLQNMIILFTLSLPEHTTIIEDYEHIFGEQQFYEVNWEASVLPRTGENIEGAILNSFIEHVMDDKDNLPKRWQIMHIHWIRREEKMLPVVHVVGKWDTI